MEIEGGHNIIPVNRPVPSEKIADASVDLDAARLGKLFGCRDTEG